MNTALVNRPSLKEWDVLVVGGGVSGLVCATTLARLGIGRVAVLEREQQPGGAPRHIHNLTFGWDRFHRPMSGPAFAQRLVTEALKAGVEIVVSASVVGLEPSGIVQVACVSGLCELTAKQICLATGARETTRHGLLVTGARPFGITTTGALQRHIHFQGKIPFRRPLVIGSEWVSLAALREMRAAGIKAVALAAPWRETAAPRLAAVAACRLTGAKLFTAASIARIKGRTRVEGVVLDQGGNTMDLACDGVLFTGNFLPEAHLVQMAGLGFDAGTRGPVTDDRQRICDASGAASLFTACGNALRGVKGSGACALEGERAAATIARALADGTDPASATIPVKAGEGLSFVLPQRVDPGQLGSVAFQVMADKPKRGRLVLRVDGTVAARKSVHAIPGRLMEFKPRASLPKDAQGLELALEDRA